MKKTFLVIGKESQLGSLLKLEIIAFLKETKKIKELKENDQLHFSTKLSELNIIQMRKTLKANEICLVGLKAHVIPEYIKKINESIPPNETVEYTVLCPEGTLKLMAVELPVNCIINVHTTMKQLQPDIFSKQQKAKKAA